MSNCISNCPPPNPCSCTSQQTCVLVGRSCTSCGENVCQDLQTRSSKGGNPAGATAGQAIGGLVAGALVAFCVYRFWYKKRRHPTAASGRNNKVRFGSDTKQESGPAPRRSRLMSRQIGQEEKMMMADEINRARSSIMEVPLSPDNALADNPFADDNSPYDAMVPSPNKDAARESDFSFRSSRSTVNIPIAYIPPHASSMSIEDGMERGALGDKRKSTVKRTTLTSLPAGSESAEMEMLASSTSGPSSPSGQSTASSSKPKPSRPAREGLDLKLPKMLTPPTTQSGFGVSPSASPPNSALTKDGRPQSGFPFLSDPPSSGKASHFSTSTSGSNDSNRLTIPGRPNSSASVDSNHLSVISHMSYLLDPPKIVTATSTGRVGVVGHAQARTVQLTNPQNTPASTLNPNTPVTPQHTIERIKTPDPRDSADDPFADQVSQVVGNFNTSAGITTPTFGHYPPFGINEQNLPYERSSVGSTAPEDFQSELGNASMRESVATDDISIFTGSSRPSTEMRHYSTTSSARDSILDNMPFMTMRNSSGLQPLSGTQNIAPGSPAFPTPPNRSPAMNRASVASNPFEDQRSELGDFSDAATHGENSPNSMHFASAGDRYSNVSRASTVASMSVRSGYGSMLDQIPFQLGFSNDRTSMFSEGSDRTSRISETGFSTSEPVPSIPAQFTAQNASTTILPPLDSPTIDDGAQLASVPPSISEQELLQTPKMEGQEEGTQGGQDGTPKNEALQTSKTSASRARESVDSFLADNAFLANSF